MPEAARWIEYRKASVLRLGQLTYVEVFNWGTWFQVTCGRIHLSEQYQTLDEAKDAGVVLAARLLAEAQHALNLYRMEHGPDYKLQTTENFKGKTNES